jgi:hypothetical protein
MAAMAAATPRSRCPVRRRLLAGALAFALGACASPDEPFEPPSPRASDAPAAAIVRAAGAWLASLGPSERRRTLYDFGDAERFDLRLAPLLLEGLRGDRMTDSQWEGVRAILAGGLSDAGLAKVETVMSLEVEVARRDQEAGGLRALLRLIRDPRRYYVALFGPPRSDAPFGLRVDGHHLSLNWTLVPGDRISVTPFFLGSEPRELPFGSVRAGLRALADEEDQARALYRSLEPALRTRATLPLTLADGIMGVNRRLFLGEGPRTRPGPPAGVRRGDLHPAQAEALDALVALYLATFEASIAAERWAAIEAAGKDEIHFAWAGDDRPDHPLYYRIQGPTFLIEFDDTVPEADHVHTIYRDFEGDFGRDLLRDHYARDHAHDGVESE